MWRGRCSEEDLNSTDQKSKITGGLGKQKGLNKRFIFKLIQPFLLPDGGAVFFLSLKNYSIQDIREETALPNGAHGLGGRTIEACEFVLPVGDIDEVECPKLRVPSAIVVGSQLDVPTPIGSVSILEGEITAAHFFTLGAGGFQIDGSEAVASSE